MNDETKALLEKANQSLLAAATLSREGFPDFAASRAYYAMFYTAEALLAEQGLSFSSHSAVISAYGKQFAKTAKLDPRFHRYLIDAQDTRNIGDYGTGVGVTQEQAEVTLMWAKSFVEAAVAFLDEVST